MKTPRGRFRESVTIAPTVGNSEPAVGITPADDNTYGILVEVSAAFLDVYNALLRFVADGVETFNLDTGGLDLRALPSESIHVQMRSNDGNQRTILGTDGFSIYDDVTVGVVARISQVLGLSLGGFEPSERPLVGLQFFYDPTPAAPRLVLRAGDSDATELADTVIPLGVPTQTYAASNVTTDRTYDANATSIDELADVLGSLIADLRAKGLVA